MKKLILAIAAVSTLSAFGQGTIGFGNSSAAPVRIDGALAPAGTRVQLYYAPSTANLGSLSGTVVDGSFELVGLGSGWNGYAIGGTLGSATGINQIAANGIFAKSTRTTGNEIAPNSQVYLQVRGWTGGYASWDLAMEAAKAGQVVKAGWTTAPWLNNTGNPLSTPAGTPADMLLGANGFSGINLTTLTPIPEPGTFALAGLAGAAMLIFRRRR